MTPPPLTSRMVFLNIFVLWRKTLLLIITVFLDELLQCYKLSMFARVAITNSHFYVKLKAIQFAPQIAPLVLLSTYRLTAVLIQFQLCQSCQHTVCCCWCYQVNCCHHLLTLILLCIDTILRHIMDSKYALADCSLIFSFVSNYDRSCVYSSGTVGATAHCFVSNYDRSCVYCSGTVGATAHCIADVVLQAVDLAVDHIPLDSSNSLAGFLLN